MNTTDGPLSPEELMAEACRLGTQSVQLGWGGPFGAVVAYEGVVVARGQNTVLLTSDVTAHGEMSAIRNAVTALNPYAPAIGPEEQNLSTLELIARPEGSDDPVPFRSKMLSGLELYTSGFPCPMCMGAIYWARISKVFFACSAEDSRTIGFDDQFQYEDFARPLQDRRIPIRQLGREFGLAAYKQWAEKTDRHPY